jgi:hypothetical protein
MPKNITTVEELRKHLAVMLAKDLEKAFTKAALERGEKG